MSSRAARRLREQQALAAMMESDSSDSGSDESSSSGGGGGGGGGGFSAFNAFAMLEDSNESEEESVSEEVKEEKKEVKVSSPSPSSGKNQRKQIPGVEVKEEEEEEDFDAVLEQYGYIPREELEDKSLQLPADISEALSLDQRYLHSQKEIRSLFGAGAKKTVTQSQHQQRGHNRHQRGHPRVNKNHRIVLDAPEPNWPPLPHSSQSGLSMELVNTEGGISYYKLKWGVEYQVVQQQFIQAVSSSHPAALLHLAQAHPYHIDALLQLSDAYRLTDEIDNASLCLRKIICFFESTWSSQFLLPFKRRNQKPDTVIPMTWRFEWKHPENRSVLLTLCRYVKLMERRGLHRTALNYGLLLWSFDLSDPFSISHLCLFLAAKCSNSLAEKLSAIPVDPSIPLPSSLPFYLALYQFQIFSKSSQPQDLEAASSTLTKAITSSPPLARALLERLSPSSPQLSLPVFASSSKETIGEGQRIVETLFVSHSYSFWKEVELVDWLSAMMSAVAPSLIVEVDSSPAFSLDLPLDSLRRYVLMSGEDDLLALLPARLIGEGLNVYDDDDSQHGVQQMENPLLDPLRLFFSSLVSDPNAPPLPDAGNGGDGPARTPADVARWVQEIVGRFYEGEAPVGEDDQPRPHPHTE
eukprot:TRINITY_DN1018_c1_g1_i1.p1 TRINITY_DN1018_c1_g1~~TRINITY_DN1018_c1_g1_i1.p1  ORF type:complete len:638 (+),score=139.25 TRINITY_DN1018_c1_g1_i1:100-2013(+)